AMTRCYCVSLSLRQKQDFSAVAVLERAWWWKRANNGAGGWGYMSDLGEKQAVDRLREEGTVLAPRPEGTRAESFHAMPLRLLDIKRWPKGTAYPDIVSDVSGLLEKLQARTWDDIN